MPLIISTDDLIYDNDLTLSGSPAVEITGNRVTFTNKAGGQINAADGTDPAILLTGTGTLLVNELGARIEANFGYLDAIVGSSGTDTIDNYGVIYGWVRLGEGNDSFTEHRSTSAPISATSVDLGSGNDSYTLINFPGQNLYPSVYGGTGEDTLTLSGPISVAYWFNFLEFEHLAVGKDVSNLVGFSGLTSLTLEPDGDNNFVQSANSTLNLTLNGNSLGISAGSSFGTITGSAKADFLSLNTNSTNPASSVGAVDLGGGDDYVSIGVFDAASPNPVFGGTVGGGAGSRDTVQIATRSSQTIDLAAFSGFEILSIGTQSILPVTARVINASGFTVVATSGYGESVSIGQSNLSDARITSFWLGTLIIESGTTVGLYGHAPGSAYNPLNIGTIEASDTGRNLNVVNKGTILGPVQLNLGDDIFDGSLGKTGGTIYGYAGNDTLTGGSSNDQIEGGWGDDTLAGGAGSDTLDGGNGFDTADYSASAGPIYADLYNGTGDGGDATGDTFISIEAVIGSSFGDTLLGTDAPNELYGNGGPDKLEGYGGDDLFVVAAPGSGSPSDDVATGLRIAGGTGYDTLRVTASVSPVSISGLEAIELVVGASLTLSAAQFNTGFYNPIAQVGMATVSGTGSLVFNMDFNPVTAPLYLTSLSFAGGSSVTLTINGTSGLDAIKGAPGVANTINGGDEADQIRGGSLADTIDGGGGNDKLFGWSGADVLTGGAGSDQFRYFFATDSGTGAAADRITDFQIGIDKFNFVIIDADPITPDDQAFTFLGTGAFTSPGTGQIRYQDSGADLLVQVDVDGNGTVDMEVVLQGLAGQTLTSGDFML